jgi:thiosulfate/3-mercaptopyruvate sulfurtransferase
VRFALAFFLSVAALAANAAFSGAIVDAPAAAKAIGRGAIVWDVRPAEKYFDGHIPGAVNVGDVEEALLDEKAQRFLPIERISKTLGAAGLDLAKPIVVYGEAGSPEPYLAQFALDYFGARSVDVFHDGIEGWRAAQKPVSSAESKRKAVRFRPFANAAMLVTTGEVIERVGSPRVQFVDVRRPGEFSGDEHETERGGHIPGAVNIPYEQNLVDPDAPRKLMAKETADTSGLHLKGRAALRNVYAGLDPHKETIVYCHTGLRAAMTAAVLTRLGFRSVRLYLASWLQYGNTPDAPVE